MVGALAKSHTQQAQGRSEHLYAAAESGTDDGPLGRHSGRGGPIRGILLEGDVQTDGIVIFATRSLRTFMARSVRSYRMLFEGKDQTCRGAWS
jgi:hypothetical protein